MLKSRDFSFAQSVLFRLCRRRQIKNLYKMKKTIIINKLHYYLTLILLIDKSVSHPFFMKNVHNLIQPRIHGGLQADPHQFSYQVSIRRVEPSFTNNIKIVRTSHYCGGALISDRYVNFERLIF